MPANSSVIGLSLPGRVELAQGWHFEAEIPVPADAAPKLPGRTHDPFHVWLDADSLPRQIELRARRRGDRFRPLGLEGHSQKLSDFLVNSKLPSRARARWPLVCAGETVIWVPGFRPGELFGLREASRRAVHFSVLQLA
jgi:tRNA(Ile)-lysidine synthase